MLSAEAFEDRFERHDEPVLLEHGCEDWQGWPHAWSLQSLAALYPDAVLSCGVDSTDMSPVLVSLTTFAAYCEEPRAHTEVEGIEAEPLYVFDDTFDTSIPALEHSYRVPTQFRHDMLAQLRDGGQCKDLDASKQADVQRPHRWLILGPAGSGTSLHRDPWGTSAWNALAFGTKLWVLFDPRGTQPDPRADYASTTLSALDWVLAWARREPLDWTMPARAIQQEAGSVLFVPSGWPHAVLNLTTTVAITHNFASPHNWSRVCESLARQ